MPDFNMGSIAPKPTLSFGTAEDVRIYCRHTTTCTLERYLTVISHDPKQINHA